jgi:hypothetical protein
MSWRHVVGRGVAPLVLNLGLDEGDWSASCSGRLTRRETSGAFE